MKPNLDEFPTRPSPHVPPTPQEPPRPHAQPPMVLTSEKQRWAYTIVNRNVDEETRLTEAELNAVGEDGWELVALVHRPGTVQFYLKRPRSWR